MHLGARGVGMNVAFDVERFLSACIKGSFYEDEGL